MITATASNPVDTIEMELDSIEIFSSQSRDDVYFQITNFVENFNYIIHFKLINGSQARNISNPFHCVRK